VRVKEEYMYNTWRSLGLLLVVPWLVNCVSGPVVRLHTGEGPPLVYSPPTPELPPVTVHQEVFLEALSQLVLGAPLTIRPRQQQGQVLFASWSGSQDAAQGFLLSQCPPEEPPDGCLALPDNAPSPETLARIRLALSFSLDSLWEGATVAMSTYTDPLAFKVMVYSAMTAYLVTLLAPEPVSKGLAALMTAALIAYLGFGPVWSMIKASWQLVEGCRNSTTPEQVRQAGLRFGRVLGENAMRVFLLLATAAIGGQANFTSRAPRLPAFAQAAAASTSRTGIELYAVGQIESVAISANSLTVSLAPTAVAMVAQGPGGGGGPRSQSPADELLENQQPQNLEKELDLARKLGVKPVSVDSPEFLRYANEGSIKWVVTQDGRLRVIPHDWKGKEISHAVANSGRPVLAAGEADIAVLGSTRFGTRITPDSGHYLHGKSPEVRARALEIGRKAFARFGINFPQ
jgi:hypothetical protein